MIRCIYKLQRLYKETNSDDDIHSHDAWQLGASEQKKEQQSNPINSCFLRTFKPDSAALVNMIVWGYGFSHSSETSM